MIIYTEQITARLSYVVNYIFSNAGISVQLTNSLSDFEKSTDFKINYSNRKVEKVFQIKPQGLLFEKGVSEAKPVVFIDKNKAYIFKQENSPIAFDVFSAVFWFISRYEEHQLFNADKHGRFPANESLLYKNELLNTPVVDQWQNFLLQKLQQFYPNIQFTQAKFKHITTIDVDSPWCFKNKGFYRNLGGIIRDGLRFRMKSVFYRTLVLLNFIDDPWFKFKWLKQQQNKYTFKLKYFVHVGDYSTFDKTVSYKNNAFREFIFSLSKTEDLALHPSYAAYNNKAKFGTEINRLSEIINKKVSHSRQHYLVFNTPNYYKMLLQLEISNDYSMGFADKIGFRAGTSRAFPYFDLLENKETKLMIHPFAFMDRTLNSYENKGIDEAIEQIRQLINNVKASKGTFISLWHNESLSSTKEWKGWQKVFIEMQAYLAG